MATKKLADNRPSTPVSLTIGLDIGYGVTKAITQRDQTVFPSVAGYSRDIKFRAAEIAQKHPADQIWDDDGHWFIGDLALNQLPAGEQRRLRGRTANESEMGNVFRLRMAKAAIAKLVGKPAHTGDTVHIRIATGLPVDHMPDSPDLKKALMGAHLIKTDQGEFVANVSEVMVMPQPYGTIYSQRLTEAGEINRCNMHRRTGVCDVGTYTIDIALDDEFEYIDSQSGSIESGVFTAQERIGAAIERDFREKVDLKTIEGVLRTGCLTAYGEQHDYADEVADALQPLRAATMELINAKWKSGLGVDVIYVSGGGAALVIDDVNQVYRQAVMVQSAQLANARGYLNYALSVE